MRQLISSVIIMIGINPLKNYKDMKIKNVLDFNILQNNKHWDFVNRHLLPSSLKCI